MTGPTDDQLGDLARLAGATADHEIDCADVLDRVAAFLKALTERAEMGDNLRQVAQHMTVCPECREELVALIRAEGLDPAAVLVD